MSDYTYKYNHQAVCPYCDYADNDSWELQGEDGDTRATQCPSCEKWYMFERHLEITYSTSKADCLNNAAPHRWEPMIGAPREYFEGREHCLVCGEERRVTEEAQS